MPRSYSTMERFNTPYATQNKQVTHCTDKLKQCSLSASIFITGFVFIALYFVSSGGHVTFEK